MLRFFIKPELILECVSAALIHAEETDIWKMVMMSTDPVSQEFTKSLVAAQPRVFAYVASLVRDTDLAHEVLQKANVVMLEKANEFIGKKQEFIPWALTVCYYEVLADRRNRARDKHVFNDAALKALSIGASARSEQLCDRQSALLLCIEKLPGQQRDMLAKRYAKGGSVDTLANDLQRPAGSISQTLYRVRKALLQCIQRRLSEGEPA